jgi:DNA-binding CsgD family transcriptional regulator
LARSTNPHLAEIRQLCFLGLPVETIARELGEALRQYLPSEHVSFGLPDSAGRPIRVVMPPPTVIPEGMFTHDMPALMRFERQSFGHDTLEYLGAGHRFQSSAQYSRARLVGSPMDDLVLRPLNVRTWVRAFTSSSRGTGLLLFGRPAGEPEYSARELGHIEAILPYITHAMGHPDRSTGPADDEDEDGLIIANRVGDVLHLCPTASLLRMLVVSPDGPVGASQRELWDRRVRELALWLEAGRSGDASPLPVWHHRNAYGRFELRAHPLVPERTAETLVAIRIRRFRSELPRVVRAMSSYGLSFRQREVALLLARGEENRAIASRLGLRPSTVADMVKNIYLRVDVNSRQALRETLLRRSDGDTRNSVLLC